jgi:hypothetical protein
MRHGSIYVITTAENTPERPWLTANYDRMVRAGRAYRGGDFFLADEPDDAEFVLFVDSCEPYLGDVTRSPLYRSFADRAYVHNCNDAAVPVVPGMYVDMPTPVRRPELQIGAFYLRLFDNEALLARDDETLPTVLFSFVGNVRTAPEVRGQIVALRHPGAHLVDRSSGMKDQDSDYVTRLRQSNFVICPRGLGPTSWRFYETMMAGRVPVIVSDRWVPAREIDWRSFALHVPEREIKSITRLCEENLSRAAAMGKRAREEWERCCALETAFGWVGRRLRELQKHRATARLHSPTQLFVELLYRKELLTFLRWQGGRPIRSLKQRLSGSS